MKRFLILLTSVILIMGISAGVVLAQAPVVTSPATNTAGTIITLTFNKAMADPAGKHLEFTYQINGGAVQNFSAAALNADPTKIELTAAGTAIAFGNTVTVNYTAGTVVAADLSALATFAGQLVQNNKAAPPTVTGAATNAAGTVITISFSKTMADPAGKHAQFSYQIGGAADQPFTAAALNVDPTKIDLTVGAGTVIANGNVVTVTYTAGTVVAADTGVLAGWVIGGSPVVTNNVPAAGAPTFVSATTNAAGTVITITFNKRMANPAGKHAEFAYHIGGGAVQAFSAAALNTDPTKIELTTSGTAILFGNVVTVDYTLGTVTAFDTGVLATFAAQPVTNGMPVPSAPTVSAAVTNVAGTTITITFNKTMADPAGKHAEFGYQLNGGADLAISAAAWNVDHTKFDLTVGGTAIKTGDVVTLKYTLGTVLAGDNGVLATFTGRAVTNNMPVPGVTLGIAGSPVAENSGVATVTATLDVISAVSTTVTLGYTGTAVLLTDYTRSAANIVVAAGALTGTMTITGVADAFIEGNKTVIIDITGVTNGTETAVQQVTAIITDDDATALAGTASVLPVQVPKGAYVNGPNGAADDNYYFQQLSVVFDGAIADGNTVTITLPSGMTIADTDDDSAVNLVDEVGMNYSTVDAPTIAVTSANTTQIVLTVTLAGGVITAGDWVNVTFPVETELNPVAGPYGYAVNYQDNTNNADLDAATGPQITYRDAGALEFVSFATPLAGDNDSTSTFGEMYPAVKDGDYLLLASGLPDFVVDGGEAQVSSNIVTYDGANTDEIIYTLWVSTDSTLSHVSEFTSGVLHAVDYDVTGNYVLNEGDRGNQDLANHERIATSGLPEGEYYFYITSDRTGNFPLMRSGKLTVLHYPVVKIMGWDYAQPVLNGFDNSGVNADDFDMFLDSGDYVNIDGSIGAASGPMDYTNLFVKVDDFDDNAQVILFYSSVNNLTLTNLVVTGPDSARVVTGLTGATELADTLFENQEDTEGFISWEWVISTAGGTYVPAGDYTLYAVASDGKHQHLLKAGGAQGIAGLTLNIRNSPNMKLNTLAEYDADGGVGAPLTVDLSLADVVMLSWGKQGVTGDDDIDNSAVISLYIDLDDGDNGTPDFTTAAALTGAAGSGTTRLIATGLPEDFESKGTSYYAWDISEYTAATGWAPTVGVGYHIYAIIDENVTGGTKRLVALDPDDANNIVEAGDALENIEFTNGGFVRLLDPPAEGITVNGEETYRMRFNAFDIDEAAYVGIFVVKTSATGYTAGPVTTTVNDLNAVAAGGSYMLTSPNGETGGVVSPFPVEGTNTYYDLTLRLPSEANLRYADSMNGGVDATDMAEGDYWVYVGLDYDALAANVFDGAQTLYRAPGKLTLRNIADEDDPVQRNLMLTPNVVSVAEGDSITFAVRGVDKTVSADLIDMYIAVEKQYFDVVRSTSPFTDLVPGAATLIANRVIDDAANNRWILNATAYEASSPLTLADADLGDILATFKLVAKGTSNAIEANSAVYFVREPANGWVTKFSNDDAEVSIVIGNQRVTQQPRGIIEGIVEFEGREASNMVVTLDLRPRGSYVNQADASFYTRNDGAIYGTSTRLAADAITPAGIQYQLDTDGHFELYQVPPGEWDLVVQYNRYLAVLRQVSVYAGLDTLFVSFGTLIGGDAIGYTDSTGVVWPNNRIESADIDRVSTAFLATSAHANWGAPNNWKWADIDEDGQVEIKDLTMATGNYTGSNVNGAQPVYAKPAVTPVSNRDASVLLNNVPATVKAGHSYTVQVITRNTADVRGYFVNLGYDTNAVSVTGIQNGNFIDNSVGMSFPVYNENAVGFTGSIYGKTLTMSGDGVLATVTFTALRDGLLSNDLFMIREASFVNSALEKETVIFNSPVAIDTNPVDFTLNQNFPNPFNPTTSISFSVPEAGMVKVNVYDILGREVRSLVNGTRAAGSHSVVWDARDNNGSLVSAGVYFYTIQAGNYSDTKRMMFVK